MHALAQSTPLPVHTEYHWSEKPDLDIAGKIGTGGCSEGYALEKVFPELAPASRKKQSARESMSFR